jgi:hypothetical protein
VSLSDISPPDAAPAYRGWRLWFDFGHYQHGIVYRETKWRAQGPDGTLLESPSPGPGEKPVDGFRWLKQQIDRMVPA